MTWPLTALVSLSLLSSCGFLSGSITQSSAAPAASTTTPTGDFKADGSVPMSGPFKTTEGTALAPAITSMGSTLFDTGFFFPFSNSIGISTTGIERIRIDSNGLVGIGSTVPMAKLDIAGEIKLGNTSSPCSATTEGQQRYNSSSKIMEFCNGTSWTSMSSYTALFTKICATDIPDSGFAVSTWFDSALNSTVYNTLNGADLANNRVVIPSAGLYLIIGEADFCAQVDPHYASAAININGTNTSAAITPVAGHCRRSNPILFRQMNINDAVKLSLFDSANGPTFGISNQCLMVLKLN